MSPLCFEDIFNIEMIKTLIIGNTYIHISTLSLKKQCFLFFDDTRKAISRQMCVNHIVKPQPGGNALLKMNQLSKRPSEYAIMTWD